MKNKTLMDPTDEEQRLKAEETAKLVRKFIKATNRYEKDLTNKLIEMDAERWKNY